MPPRLNVENRYLFVGDNLPFLLGINSNCVDLIYLDPPRNSGRLLEAAENTDAAGFEYDDAWTANDIDYAWLDNVLHTQYGAFAVTNAVRVSGNEGLAAYLTFMGKRLMELHRILKPGGSIYLHCSPHTSHYLRALMDSIFGYQQFRNEIILKRPNVSAGAKRWRWTHDTLLFYAGPRKYRWNQVPQQPSPEYMKRYRLVDERGRFHAEPLLRPDTRNDERGTAWRGIDPGKTDQHWAVSTRVLKHVFPERDDLDDLGVIEKLDLLDESGLVYRPPSGGLPRYKIYADMSRGERLSDLVTNMDPIDRRSEEFTGWPEQSPEALLDIIIRASSNQRDVVLDPFCGSGTTCVVAERLGRQWIGIEQDPQTWRVLRRRLRRMDGRPRPIIMIEPIDRTDLDR